MEIFIYELLGTALMILLGNGVVAACCLEGTKCGGAGAAQWMVITTAWGFGVFVGVVVAGPHSGAHLNPVVTLSLVLLGKVSLSNLPVYLAGEFLGAMLGALLVYGLYYEHFKITQDAGAKRACFCTEPALRNPLSNFLSELVGAFVLIFVILHFSDPSIHTQDPSAKIGLGSLGALPVALLVWAIGLSLGSTTGYAINPARDMGPRIVLALLPLKVSPDFAYGWIPFSAPLVGGALAVGLYSALGAIA
ncbi:MIP/aquaporin family protein [Helicobacter vulpis]|uniref:MIP/aquaporin family protein n=1 Tax=Helicobacter vulpis TaxID=2316076 RepID=UPI000EAB94C7|nr:MIP/aquaporin family protein [Helicobacter vulpis]